MRGLDHPSWSTCMPHVTAALDYKRAEEATFLEVKLLDTHTPLTLSKSDTTKEDIWYYISAAQILNSIMRSCIHPSILASPFSIACISPASYHWET
jgi:hypothetical protein